MGDDKASPAFERFARQVEQSNKAVGRNQAALKKQQDQQDSTSRSLAGLIGSVSGFGDVATAASSKSSIFARALGAVNVATGVAEPALAGLLVTAGGIAAAYASAAAGLIAYQAALKPLLAETKVVADAQTKLDKARTTAQIAYTAALAGGAKQKTADAARTRAMTTAQKQYNAAIKGTPASVVLFSKSLTDTQDAFKAWANRLSEPVLQPLTAALALVRPALKSLSPLVLAGAKALSILEFQFARFVDSGGLAKVVQVLLPHVQPAILGLGHSIANIAVGLGGVVRAFLPMADTVTRGVTSLTAKFAEWGRSLPSHTGFQSLMATFRNETPLAVAVLKNLAVIIRNVAAATVGLASPANSKALLQILTPLSQIMVRLTANAGLVRAVLYFVLLNGALSRLKVTLLALRGGVSLFTNSIGVMQKAGGVLGRLVGGYQNAAVAASAFSGTAGTIGGKLASFVAKGGATASVLVSLIGPLGAAAAAIGVLAIATNGFRATQDKLGASIDRQVKAAGYSAAAFGKLAQQTDVLGGSSARAQQSLSTEAASVGDAGFAAKAAALKVEFLSQVHTAAAAAARSLSSQLGTLADAYGLSQAGAAQLAAKAGVSASALAAGGAAGQAAFRKIVAYAGGAGQATVQSIRLTTAQNALKTSLDKVNSGLLTGQQALLNYQQAQKTALQAINASSTGLRGQSSAALAARQAVLQMTQSAIDLAGAESHQKNGMDKASQTIRDQIHWLEVHGGKSRFARQEVDALREALARLKSKAVHITVTGTGQFTVSRPGGGPGIRAGAARGAFIRTGKPGVDDQLIMAQRGELVVPTAMVRAGLVDHLRGMIPGFAAGGIVPAYQDGPRGLGPWARKDTNAFTVMVEKATAKAGAAAIRSAQSAGGFGVAGPGGGDPARNAALARRMFPSVDWPSWNYVAMRESGWNQFARNPKSGAYGIPQALPPSKMGPAANPPQSNPAAQISWMVGYMNSRYGGSPGAAAHERAFNWYADGGVVGDAKWPRPPRPPKHDPQRKKWLDQLARDVKVLQADEKHARIRRKALHRSLAIDELWFLTHPHVKRHGIGWNEHEKALMRDRRLLRHFNKMENAKETELSRKIAILRLLTHYPKGRKYGGPGTPAPPGDSGGGGDGGGDLGGGDTGGGTTAPSGPPPIPPPPMPAWMVTAGLGTGAAAPSPFMFPSPVMAPMAFGGGMGMPDPIASRSFSGGRFMGGGGGGGFDLGELIAEIRNLHQGVVGAVQQVAPGVSRGVDRSQNSMAARVAGRFS